MLCHSACWVLGDKCRQMALQKTFRLPAIYDCGLHPLDIGYRVCMSQWHKNIPERTARCELYADLIKLHLFIFQEYHLEAAV